MLYSVISEEWGCNCDYGNYFLYYVQGNYILFSFCK